MEIIIALGSLLIGFFWGWHSREAYATRVLNKFLKIVEEKEQEDDDLIQLTLEKDGDCLFAYDKKTSAFLAKGVDKDSLEKELLEKFSGKRFGCSVDNLKKVGIT